MTAREKSAFRVICETCGAPRGKRCRSIARPPGMPRGMLALWNQRAEVKAPHKARVERGQFYALNRIARNLVIGLGR